MVSKYDKTISFKASIEQFDKINNHASALHKDVSDVLRDFIDEIDINEREVLKMMDYHEFHIKQLQTKLANIKQKKEELEKEKLQKKEQVKNNIVEKEIKQSVSSISSEIIRKVGEKYQKDLFSDDPELVEKAKKNILRFVKEEIERLDNEKVQPVTEKVTHYLSKFYFLITEKDIISEI